MQLFKYVTLTLCQQQHLDDVVLPARGKQSHLSKERNKEDGTKSKEYEFDTKILHGKA